MGGFGQTLGLYFEIAADPSNAQKALKDFQSSVASSLGMSSTSFGLIASDIESKMGLAQGSLVRTGLSAKAAAKDLAYLGAGAAAIAVGAVVLAEKWADAGTKIFEASEKTGLSARNLSGLRATTQVLDESFDGLTLTLSRLGKNIEAGLRNPASDAGKTLQSLFKSSAELRELGLKPLDERIAEVDKRIFALNTTSQQNLALTALAGRGYNEVRSTLQELGREGYDPLIERAKKLGQYFDEQSAARAREFKIQIAELKTEVSGLALGVGRQLVPALSQWVALTEVKLQQGLGKNLVQATRDAAAGMLRMFVAVQTLGASELFLGDETDRVTLALAGGGKETQGMTDKLVALHAMVEAAKKGTGELGDKVEKTQKAHKAWSTDLSELNSIFRELRGAQDPITQAHEKYRQILERIATATGPAYNATLLEKMALEQRDSVVLKVFLADQEKIDQAIVKHVPTLQALAIAQTLGGNARLTLNAAQRAALPLEEDETNALARILAASRSMVDEMNLGELPARQRINTAIDRQIEAARREIAVYQERYKQGHITLAALEAAEQQYTNTVNSLSHQRQAMLKQEVEGVARTELQQMRRELELTQVSFLNLEVFGGQAFMGLSQAMGRSIADAIVYEKSIGAAMAAALKSTLASIAGEAMVKAIQATALGFYLLAIQDYSGAGKAFTSAALYGTIGGVAAAVGAAIPGGGTQNATAAASPGGAVASAAGATGTAPALAPGAASATASGQAKEPTPPQTVIVHLNYYGDYLALPQAGDHLARVINDAVTQRDVQLVATRALKPAYAVR